jgi:chromosome segregation ATPase
MPDDLYEKIDNLERCVISELGDIALMQLMLKDLFCNDKKNQDRYNNMKNFVLANLRQQLGETPAGELIMLREQTKQLQNNNYEMLKRMELLIAEIKKLRREIESSTCKYDQLNAYFEQFATAMWESIKWYKKLVAEVPEIRKRNSGWIRVQTWEGALIEYEQHYPQPQLMEWDWNKLWTRLRGLGGW